MRHIHYSETFVPKRLVRALEYVTDHLKIYKIVIYDMWF